MRTFPVVLPAYDIRIFDLHFFQIIKSKFIINSSRVRNTTKTSGVGMARNWVKCIIIYKSRF